MYDSDQSYQLETLVYASTATKVMTQPSLYSLITKARSHNRRLGVTGALLYADQCFLQALEGRPEDLDRLLENIAGDARHQDLTVFYRGATAERGFPGWSLAFPNTTYACGGIIDLAKQNLSQSPCEEAGAEMLASLRDFYEATQLVAYG